MRTDAKVGLIAAFIVVLALVAYFAWEGKKPESTSLVGPKPEPGLTMGTDTGSSGLRVIPPTLVSPATATAPASEPAGTMFAGGFTGTAPGATAPAGFGVPSMSPSTQSAFGTATSRPAWEAAPPSTRPTWESGLTLGGSTSDHGTSSGSTILASDGGTYTVVKNDTLAKIAAKNHVTVQALRNANKGTDLTKLPPGKVIKLPPAPTGGSAVTSSVGSGRDTSPAIASAATTAEANTPGGTYTVKSGDTLTKISKQIYGDTKYVDRIAKANRAKLPNPDVLKVGLVLKLPPK